MNLMNGVSNERRAEKRLIKDELGKWARQMKDERKEGITMKV